MKDVFEELIVVKRSGQRVNFNEYKIAVAIKQAFDDINGNYDEKNINKIYEDVLSFIINNYNDRKTINVEDIQDIIEQKLKEKNYLDVYTAFSEYRKKRAVSRQVYTVKQQHKFAKAMEKIADDNILKSENNYLPKDILINYGKTVANEFSKAYIIDNKYLRNHEEGNIFIHDLETFPLGMISHTHLMLDNFLESDTSINNLTNYIIDSKDEISGEVNISSIDYLLSNWFINEFKKIYKENLTNYLKVSGFYNYVNIKKIMELINKEQELPFNLQVYEPYILSSQVDIIFNYAYDDTYNKLEKLLYHKIKKMVLRLDSNSYSISFGTNDSLIGTIINETIIKVLTELDRLNNISFIYKLRSLDDKFIDSICELIINKKNIILSFENTTYNKDKEKIEYFANGIRVFDNNNDIRKSNGRMVIATTSINMARLGLKYENLPKKKLYERLDELLELVKNELLLSFEMVGNKNKDNYKILFNNNILYDEKLEKGQKIRKVIKNGNLNIGLIGLKECVMVLCKDSDKQYKLLLELLKYINDKCILFSKETKLNFYVCEPFNTNASKELIALDKAIYGIRKGITENSSYALVSNLFNDYDKLGKIQKLFTGGNVIEINISNNITHKKMRDIIKELYESDVGLVICK